MDKYEYTIKSDKIKKLVERKDYETAVKIADTIDWERVRNIKMLSTVSVAYEKVSRFEEAKDLLLMAYECAPVGRRFLYKLTELAIKQGQFDEAEQYLKEFAATSPQDPSRLLLRYEISKAKGEPTERLITILEAYQKREFEERWSYELANLYYRVGKNEECVKLCDEIVLWFGVGTYVDKAMELKQRIAPLTPDQIEKRENKEKYLRRLEEVQKEFEDRYRVVEEPTREAVEQTVASSQELAATVEAVMAEEAVEVTEDAMTASEEALCAERMEQEAKRLQEEMEASLAREIEAATLTAALNEAMLRETAASMEAMEPVKNDHSQEHERTKVAVVHVSMQEKTKEFVREAKVINVVLEEVRDRVVTAEEVEARLQQETPAVEDFVEEKSVVEESVAEEPAIEESTVEEPVIEEPAIEVPAEEEPVTEEPVVEAPVVEEMVDEKAVAEDVVEQEPAGPAVHDHYVLVTCAQEDEGVKECVAYIRRMRELLGYPVTQIAKIRGEKLATKNMAQTLRKLQGRDLMVVGIADLPDSLLMQTVELMAADTIESFIALIGTEQEIADLQSRLAFFAGCRVISCVVETPIVPVPVIVPESMVSVAPVEAEVPAEKSAATLESVSSYIETEAPAQERSVAEAEEKVNADEQSMLAKMVEEALRATSFGMEQMEEASEEVSVVEPADEPSETVITETVVKSAEAVTVQLTPNEFYECAVQYAHMMDAKVDDLGGLAIYAVAEEYQQEREPLTEELAQELVENAIAKAERRTLKSLFSNRYDKEGFLILKEQHFKE